MEKFLAEKMSAQGGGASTVARKVQVEGLQRYLLHGSGAVSVASKARIA
jgi:hypothetical protein